MTFVRTWQQEVKIDCYDGQTGLLVGSSGKVKEKRTNVAISTSTEVEEGWSAVGAPAARLLLQQQTE